MDKMELMTKIVMAGDSGVGKTNLLLRAARNKFMGDTLTTIGIDFFTMTFEFERLIARATIWDTAGQERFRVVSNASYRGAQGVIVVYDITNRESFQNVPRWISDIREVAPSASVILLGNKSDLIHLRAVGTEEARVFAKTLGLAFMETSARDASNVKEAFRAVLEDVMDEFLKNRLDLPNDTVETKGGKTVPIRPYAETDKTTQRSNCCL